MSEHPQRGEEPPIHEREASWPWWGWALFVCCLAYAFLIGPFNWFSP